MLMQAHCKSFMRRNNVLLTILVVLVPSLNSYLFAQTLGTYYSKNFIGENIKLGYSFSKKDNYLLEFGGIFHFNKNSYNDNNNNYFKNKGYAKNLANHFGIFGKSAKNFYRNDFGLNLYGFLGFDYLFLTNKNEIYQNTGNIDTSGLFLYNKMEFVFDNFHCLDINLGIGSNIRIDKRLSLILETGLSTVLLIHPSNIPTSANPSQRGYTGRYTEFDYPGWHLKIGIGYFIGKMSK